ncbi:MAG: VWA domain-containing protein [Thermoanaerobaculia bacterium]|nr:VWA domain-containing protein [Thermoanaerobaculia bacterium]
MLRPTLLLLASLVTGAVQAAAEPPPEPAATGTQEETAPDGEPELAPEFSRWLEQVELLITEEEREYFLSLTEDFRRRAFIDEFWRVRDPDPESPWNEAKRGWLERVDQALEDYGSLKDARAVMFVTNGPPGGFVLPDGRVISICFDRDRELELWFYGSSERTESRFVALFWRRDYGLRDRPYLLWMGFEVLRPAKRFRLPSTNPSDFCESDILAGAIALITRDLSYASFLEEITSPPKPAESEWVASFAANSTDLPPGADTFEVALAVDFPGRNQNRTAVQGILTLEPEAAAVLEQGGEPVRRFLMLGEVIRDDRLLESFRYRFEIRDTDRVDGRIPLVFQRYLRPGAAELRIKVEDLFGRRFASARQALDVPSPRGRASLRKPPEGEIFRLLAEANLAAQRGQTTLRLVPPEPEEIQVGGYRFHTVTTGEVSAVTFLLNGQELLTKRRPPFSVELDLGPVAATHRLRAVGLDDEGDEVASDELLVNRGGQRFRIRLTEPVKGRSYAGSVSAVMQIEVPDGRRLDKVELYLGERQVATLYQEPFVQPILLEDDGLSYVRAVAHLADGLTTEDVVFINAPDYFEEIEVVYVELFASVFGRGGRPVLGLGKDDFRVWEDGVEQQVRRFEFVRDLPIHAGLLLDTSSSMAEGLATVVDAARGFVEEAIRPKDRLALFSFNSQPRVESKFTGSPEEVTQALAGLRARGSTALYDSLVFALHYFDGIKGQKALVLLSDGKDEASYFDVDGALQTAQRAGVTIYVIGLKELARDRDARKVLNRFAEETGGRSFFIENTAELPAIYRTIQNELRSQYLLTYQSASEKDPNLFRRVRVEVDRAGAEVRTLAGYYP